MTAYLDSIQPEVDTLFAQYGKRTFIGLLPKSKESPKSRKVPKDKPGKPRKGPIKVTIAVTKAGLAAAIHREGGPQVRSYFTKWGGHDTYDKPLNSKDLAIQQRLREAQRVTY